MDFKERIFSSTLYRVIGNLVNIAIVFFLTPYMMRILGDDGYGLWLLLLATVGWFKFADLGFSLAVQRSLSIALEANDERRANVIFSCSVLLFLALGTTAAFFAFLLSFYPSVLGVEESYYSVTQMALMILSLKLIWDVGMCSIHGFLAGMLRYDVDANIDTATEISKAIIIVLSIESMGIYGVVLAVMASEFIANIFKLFYVKKRVYPALAFSMDFVEKQEFLDLYHYSKHVFALSVAYRAGLNADRFIISHLLNLSAITIFGIATRLITIVEQLYLSMLGVFGAVLFRLVARKGDVQEEMEQVISMNYFLVASMFVPLMVFADDFVNLWLGEGYEATYTLVIALAFAYATRTVSRPINTVLLARAEHKLLSVVKIIGVILNILLSIVLGGIYGLIGIAVGTVIGFLITEVVMHLVLYKKYTGHSITTIVTGFIKMNVFIVALTVIGMNVLQSYGELNWIELILFSGVTTVITVSVLWVGLLNTEVKEKIVTFGKNKFLNRATNN